MKVKVQVTRVVELELTEAEVTALREHDGSETEEGAIAKIGNADLTAGEPAGTLVFEAESGDTIVDWSE